MIILVDMDGVIADFEGKIIDKLKNEHPEIKIIENTAKRIQDLYEGKGKEIIKKIKNSKGFIKNLKTIKGSKEALEYLRKKHEVFVCSRPLSNNEHSLKEKLEWVKENLGGEWKKRLIIIEDKTLIKGDILMDDEPEINGLLKPSFEHVIFDAPYNRQVKNKKRINWDNYKEIQGV